MNWVIWRVVRYFFHCSLSANDFFDEAKLVTTHPDLGTTSSSVVVVVCQVSSVSPAALLHGHIPQYLHMMT